MAKQSVKNALLDADRTIGSQGYFALTRLPRVNKVCEGRNPLRRIESVRGENGHGCFYVEPRLLSKKLKWECVLVLGTGSMKGHLRYDVTDYKLDMIQGQIRLDWE